MLRRTLLSLACVTACATAALPPARLAAQDPGVREPRRTLSTLQDSARLRLTAPGVYVEDGRFLGFQHDSVRVSDADAVLRVGAEEIESLSVRGNKWLGVGAQSAAVGVVAGALSGFFFGTKDCGQILRGCDAQAGRRSLRWGLSFGAVGGVLGALVGSRMQTWKKVFP